MDWDDEYDSPGYYDFMEKPLLSVRRPFPISHAKWGDVDEEGYHFSHSTINEDGEQCVTWKKEWHFLGMTVLKEKHGKLCECSYCKGDDFTKRRGIVLPKCRCRNAWRIFYWRKAKWPCELSCIRFTLPRYPFVWWRCRFCRKKERGV